MELTREEVVSGYQDALRTFSELLRALDATALSTPTRCEGWTVGDVGAHVIGTTVDIVAGNIEGQGTPEVTERQVVDRRGRTGAELADELDGAAKAGADLLALFDDAAWTGPAPGGFGGTLGQGVEALWYDIVLHTDDIGAALGRASAPGAGLKVAVRHVADILDQQSWGPATLRLDGYPDIAVGGGGDIVHADPWTFVLAATGRGDVTALGLDDTVNIYR